MSASITNLQSSAVDEWFQKYGWQTNPFSFKIFENIMIGNHKGLDELLKNIDARSAFNLVIGKTGAGKTNLMKWLTKAYRSRYDIHYIPKPPERVAQLLEFFSVNVLKQGFLSKKFSPLTEHNVYLILQKKLRRPTIVIFDEGHEAPIEVLSWIRALVDHISNLLVIATGTPEFVSILQKELPTLFNRAPSVIMLEPLTKDEVLELVRKRIECAGGNGVEPFTYDCLTQIYESSQGFPRDILRLCHQAVIEAIRSDRTLIDNEILSKLTTTQNSTNPSGEPVPPRIYTVQSDSPQELGFLSDKQQEIYECIQKMKEATPSELINSVDTSRYQSKAHALRSINNVLTRMMQNNLVERRRKGRTYIYKIKQI